MRLKDILRDRTRGSGELLREAVAWLRRHPDTLDEMQLAFTLDLLRKARPTMAGFARLADRIESGIAERRTLSPRDLLHDIARSIEKAEDVVLQRFVAILERRGPGRAVTLSWSSAVLHAIGAAGARIVAVRVLESQPGGEGERLAEALSDIREGVLLMPDDQLPEAAAWADFAMIGADTVFADGAVLNKVLSRSLAEEMARQGKPFYVLATQWKRTPLRSENYRPDMHDRGLFEVVPASLITELVSDE